MGTVPQKRLSWLWSRLSPMTKTSPSGTVNGPKLSRGALAMRSGVLS